MDKQIDILILSNGPGEITTWVQPVVQAIRNKLSAKQARISVILSPCPNATGKEAKVVRSYLEVDRVQSSEHFFAFLLQGKTAENWHWHQQGMVLFLGGDQFFSLVIAKRLNYRTIIYAEWEARWYRYLDHFAVMNSEILKKIPHKYHHKFTVIGDLMADVSENQKQKIDNQQQECIGLLPGSKAAKLTQGVPLCLAIAEKIQQQKPQIRFILPVAPTLDLQTLAKFANPQTNPFVSKMGGIGAELIMPESPHNLSPFLKTIGGVKVELITEFPAYQALSQCCLCLTTIGANTAQLGALAIPMIILLPIQQLDAMRAWDGLPGILANLPGIGFLFAKIINGFVWQQTVKKGRLYAWPNLWAKQQIVPELVGELQPENVAIMVLDYLNHPEKLIQMGDNLRKTRGNTGAAAKFAEIIWEETLKFNYNN
jgi:hypothetical protein